MGPVVKAVIPAAGRGTRLEPLTRSMPKELLPLGDRPLIHRCLDELRETAVREVAVVLRKEKEQLHRYLSDPGIASSFPFEIRLIEQPEPLGVGDAIARARGFVGKEPFALLSPDFHYEGHRPAIAAVLDAFEKVGESVIALQWVEASRARGFGNCGSVDLEPLRGPLHRVSRLYPKGEGEFRVPGGGRILRTAPREVLTEEFFDALDSCTVPGSGERDDVPALQILARRSRLAGVALAERGFDLGSWEGYHAALHALGKTP